MTFNRLVLATALLAGLTGASLAQQPTPPAAGSAGSGPAGGPGSGMMQGQSERMQAHGMGHGRWHERGFLMGNRFCQSTDPVAPRMLGRLENTIRPTDAQKPEMDALRAAATKAETIMRAACPAAGDDDRSPPARLAQMEKRVTAMAEALKTVRPAFDALYAKLDDKQRDRMRWARGRQ